MPIAWASAPAGRSRACASATSPSASWRATPAPITPPSIARFRQRHGEALKGLFTDILRLCKEAGLVRVGVVALDGTKMAADAALEANRTYESIRKEVETMLTEAETKDIEEDGLHGPERHGDGWP